MGYINEKRIISHFYIHQDLISESLFSLNVLSSIILFFLIYCSILVLTARKVLFIVYTYEPECYRLRRAPSLEFFVTSPSRLSLRFNFFVVLLTDTVLKLLQPRNAVRTSQILMDVLQIKNFPIQTPIHISAKLLIRHLGQCVFLI